MARPSFFCQVRVRGSWGPMISKISTIVSRALVVSPEAVADHDLEELSRPSSKAPRAASWTPRV